MIRAVRASWLLLPLAALAWCGLRAAASAPVLFQSAPGRFEVASAGIEAARAVVGPAGEVWTALAPALDLPEAFSSPVYVRVVPAADWAEPAPFRVIVEAGGLVSLRLRDDLPEGLMRRALVQSLLTRLAVWRHGRDEHLAVPLWLELGCADLWRTQAEPAQFDALQQRSAVLEPPRLDGLLRWERGAPEPPAMLAGAAWLVRFLMTESSAGEWRAFRDRLLAGEEPWAALVATYPGRFADRADAERWWLTGWHELRRIRTLPTLEAAASRAVVADAARFVFVERGEERVVPVAEWPDLARSAAGRAELRAHAARLGAQLVAMHPFYRNAALSLVRLLTAAEASGAPGLAAAQRQFDADWRDASELEAAANRALDTFEAAREPR